MEPTNCIKVKRDGPRGWHWIAKDAFDPAIHELVDLPPDSPSHKGGSKPRAKKGASA